jgi:competence protein ComEA
LAGLFIGAMIVSAGLFVARRPPAQPIAIHPAPTPTPVEEPTATFAPEPSPTPSEIVVFVSGAVNAPGNYRLPPDARVGDALDAAGGFTGDAQTDAVNLAAPLRDGDHIDFPAIDEPTPTPTSTATPTATPPLTAGEGGGEGGDTGTKLININTATQAELETLPGIGPAKAAAIIANRPYASVDDLDRVPGIGPATIANLRPLVTVE